MSESKLLDWHDYIVVVNKGGDLDPAGTAMAQSVIRDAAEQNAALRSLLGEARCLKCGCTEGGFGTLAPDIENCDWCAKRRALLDRTTEGQSDAS